MLRKTLAVCALLVSAACSVDEISIAPSPTPTPAPPPSGQTSISIANAGFETTAAWSGLQVRSDEYFAPPEGDSYAIAAPGDAPLQITLGDRLEAGRTYTLRLWSRSIYNDAHVTALQRSGDNFPPLVSARASVRADLLAGSTVLASTSVDVSPRALSGAPATLPNDDGGNIWVDGQFRHAFADNHLVQPVEDDPITDPWVLADDNDAYRAAKDDQGAVAPVISAGGQRLFYTTAFIAEDANQVRVTQLDAPTGSRYDWNAALAILQSEQSIILDSGGVPSNPITFDQHAAFDATTGRLWMSWGGATIYVSEVDPQTGRLASDPQNTTFADAAAGTHTKVADWSGDEWTGAPEPGSEYFEGPALLQNGEFWYLFASYSNLGTRYTIRMGRSDSPQGPFRDKRGRLMTEFDAADNEFGNSFFLGDDTDQLVPGHPHFWEEGGQTYVGYDYRNRKAALGEPEPRDILGIRRVFFVDGWPTIWTPIEVTFEVPQGFAQTGQMLGIRLSNDGVAGSVAAFDRVTLISE